MIKSDLVNIEYGPYPNWQEAIKQETLLVVMDDNTKSFIRHFESYLKTAKQVIYVNLGQNVIPNERTIDLIKEQSSKVSHIIGLGSGTISDLCKYVATHADKALTLIPTAPSMDGYLSKGSALILKDTKVTEVVKMPHHVLINLSILVHAPKRMIASGYGDIFAKYTCLTDWQFANILHGEPILQEAFDRMKENVLDTTKNVEEGDPFAPASIEKLMDGLLIAGIAMAITGHSRPASGSEHHMSHFLELKFLNKKDVPFHGEKVATGTLIAIQLYTRLNTHDQDPRIVKIIEALPTIESLSRLYQKVELKTTFKALDVSKELFVEMLQKAHLIRPRYTVLTYYHEHKIMDEAILELANMYY